MDEQQRKQIFYEELVKLLKGKYISNKEYEKITFLHSKYYKNKKTKAQDESISEKTESYEPAELKVSDKVTLQKKAPIKVKKDLSQQEIRDRNISTVLILGVVLVLLSGLVLATSNWSMLTNYLKTVLIVFVAVLFFVISLVGDRVLKIEKTAFAFWVLGSLFLPVAILSAGYFKLFGEWLSVFGEGRYVLGIIGAIMCVPIYVYSASRYKNRFFVWISYITITVGVYNLIAAFRPKADLFFFVIVIYNSIVMLSYAKLKVLEKYNLFTKELYSFAQINLIISTVLTLIIYDNNQFYGLNMILFAILYGVMVYNEGRKEYVYVFSGLVTYGIYQIIEHSYSGSLDLLLLPAIGFVFIMMERYKKTDESLKSVYKYLNAIITTFTFIYITTQATISNPGHATIMMAIAYLIISFNFIYLSYTSNKKVFNYAAPMFIVATGLQIYRVVQELVVMDITSISIFIIAFFLFFLVYYRNYSKYLYNIRNSSGAISYILIIVAVFFSLTEEQWLLSTFILYFSNYMLYVFMGHCKNKCIVNISKWNMPLNILLGTFVLFGKITESYIFTLYDGSYHFGVCVLILFVVSLCWRKVNKAIMNAFFIVAHLFMPFSIWILGMFHYDNPIVFIVPTLVYIYSAFFHDKELLKKVFLYAGLVTSTLTLFSLFSLLKLEAQQNYVMIMVTVLMTLFWYVYDGEWKKRITPFLLVYGIIGSLIFNVYDLLGVKDFYPAIVYVIIISYVMHKEKLDYLIFLPLCLLFQALSILDNPILFDYSIWRMIVSLVAFVGLIVTGKVIYKGLYEKTTDKHFKTGYIDWYAIFALFILLSTFYNDYGSLTKWFSFIVFTLISFLIYSQINRVPEESVRKIVVTLSIVSLMLPYYKLIDNLNIPAIVLAELSLLPLIVVITVLYKKIWKDSDKGINVLRNINTFTIVLISLILLKDVAIDNYLVDRLILGVLSLFAIFIGMQSKVKVYFWAGIMTLILNVLIQTKELWLNIPWWGYLLISGLILIGMASYKEIQKNKDKKNKSDEEDIEG